MSWDKLENFASGRERNFKHSLQTVRINNIKVLRKTFCCRKQK